MDTLRADRVGAYGYEQATTPAIDALAGDGIVFENAIANTSWTLPSLSSTMTGLYPTHHGVRTWNHRLDDRFETLAELLAADGYSTAAIVGTYGLDRSFGLGQGFAHYDDEMDTAVIANAHPLEVPESWANGTAAQRARWRTARDNTSAYRADAIVADRAIEWLDRRPAGPFFLWVHFVGPHEKDKRMNLPPARRRAHHLQQIARYDKDTTTCDEAIGRILARLREDGTYDRMAVVLHSDHGQSLNEHGHFGHGFDLFETTVRVPLVLRLPQAAQAGRRVPQVVRNLDVFATILGIAGVARPPGTVGDDLHGELPTEAATVYLETYLPTTLTKHTKQVGDRSWTIGTTQRGVRTDRWKLIVREQVAVLSAPLASGKTPPGLAERPVETKLFDVLEDPGEQYNLAADHPDIVARLYADVRAHDPSPSLIEARDTLSTDAEQRLRALGYLE